MSSSSNNFNSSRPTWREREALKERQQREAAAKAAEEQQRKQYANNEVNFPSTMAARPTVLTKTAVPQGFSAMASKWQQQEELERQLEAYRKSNSDRERRAIIDTVYVLRRRHAGFQDEDDDVSTLTYETEPEEEDLNEKFPPHGKRGTYSEPDSEGWRLVLKRQRKEKRTLSEAELAKKYRDTFFAEDEYESDDMNGDLTDRNQRRTFY